MFKPKFRNLIPKESDPQKNKDKSTYFETYDIGNYENKIKLLIKSIHTEKSNYDVYGNFLYSIQNNSHFEIDSEIDFSESRNIRTQEKDAYQPNKKIFRCHIDPYDNFINNKKNKNENENNNNNNIKGICKVQYIRGYIVKAKLKCAFTFPSKEKQKIFVVDDHQEIEDILEKWKKYKPSQIEQLLLFVKNKNLSYENLFNFYDNDNNNIIISENNSNFSEENENSVLSNSNNNNINNNNNNNNIKKIFYVDQIFPPCQTESITIDLNEEITTNPKLNNTENSKEKKKIIIYHYRSIENIFPNIKNIITKSQIDPYDINYGIICNINIIGIFSHLCEYPNILLNLFPDFNNNNNNVNYFGMYKIKLFINNCWTNIYLDKFIPCFPLDFPIYTYNKNSLWSILIEKGLAKIFGNYDNLKNISYFELYQILTGFPVLNFKKVDNDINNKNIYIVNSNLFCNNNNNNNNRSNLVVNDEYIIDMYLHNKNYMIGFYASNEYLMKQFEEEDDNINNKNDNNNNKNDNNIYNNKNNVNNNNNNNNEIKKNKIKKKMKIIENKIFCAKNADEHNVYIKSIFNFQLKLYLEKIKKLPNNLLHNIESKSNETLAIPWNVILNIFDNIIIIKVDNYQYLNFRNCFVRCNDYESPDYDKILATHYYELTIKDLNNINNNSFSSESYNKQSNISTKTKKNSNRKNYVNLTITLNLGNEHFLDNNFFYNEMDWKIGILRLDEKLSVIKYSNLKNSNNNKRRYNNKLLDPFKGKNPIIIDTPDFIINKSLVFDIKLEEGEYIIVPMTMGYCMQKNPKIKFKNYTLFNSNIKNNNSSNYINDTNNIENSIISKFLDDLFLKSDPFNKNFLNYNVINTICNHITNNKGKKNNGFDYETFIEKYSRIDNYDLLNRNKNLDNNNINYNNNEIDNNNINKKSNFLSAININNFGLGKNAFKELIFELIGSLNEDNIKLSMENLGYNTNMYPFLGRFFGINFYFSNIENYNPNQIKIIPKLNLQDNNMDSIVNIRILEKKLNEFKKLNNNNKIENNDDENNDNNYNPYRVFYTNKSNWYTLEGVSLGNKNGEKKKLYTFEGRTIYKEKDVFYSTNKSDLKTMIHSGKLKFIMYVVDNVLYNNNNDDNINNNDFNNIINNNENEEEEEVENKELKDLESIDYNNNYNTNNNNNDNEDDDEDNSFKNENFENNEEEINT